MNTTDASSLHTQKENLFERVSPVVALAARLMGVRAAYLRRDGKDFILTGDDWSSERSEQAAELSVALQYSLMPTFEFLIEGGYEPQAGTPPGDYVLIYEKQ